MRFAAASLLPALVAGCMYLPPSPNQFNRKSLSALRAGEVTRAGVDSLVAPDRVFLSAPRVLGVEKHRSGGVLILAAAGPQGGGGGGVLPITSQRYRMLFRFDDGDVLRGFEVEPSRAEHDPVPGQPVLPAESSPVESLSFRASWRSVLPHFRSVAVDPAGRIAAGDGTGRLWLWPAGGRAGPMEVEVREPADKGRERELDAPWVRLAFTDGARALACLAEDGVLAIVPLPPEPWTSSNPVVAAPRWTRRRVTALDASPADGSLGAAMRDGSAVLLDAASGAELASWAREKKATPVAIAISPDGLRLAVAEERPPDSWMRILDCCRDPERGLPAVTRYPLEAGVRVAGMRFTPDGRVLAVDALSHVRWLGSADGGDSGSDSLTLAGAFLRPFTAGDALFEVRVNVVSRACPPVIACDGGAVAIVAERLLVYSIPGPEAAPRCLLQGSRRTGAVHDVAAVPGTRRIVAATGRGLFVWEVPLALP